MYNVRASMTSCKIHGKVKALIILVTLPQLDLDQILKNLEYDIFLQMIQRELKSVTRVKNCNNVVFCPELLCGPTTTSLVCYWMCYYVSNCCVDISETSESWNAITPD